MTSWWPSQRSSKPTFFLTFWMTDFVVDERNSSSLLNYSLKFHYYYKIFEGGKKKEFFFKAILILDLLDSFSHDLQCLKFRMSFSCIYMVLPEVRFRNEIYRLFRKFPFQKISISKMLPQVKRWALKAFLN